MTFTDIERVLGGFIRFYSRKYPSCCYKENKQEDYDCYKSVVDY